MTDARSSPLEGVLDEVLHQTAGTKVSVDDIFKAFGDRTFGPVLTLLGLFALSPIGAIPGIPAAIGVIIMLIAGQLASGRDYLWLPSRLESIRFDREKIVSVRKRASTWLCRIDKIITERMDRFTGAVARRLAAATCIVLAALMIPLEIIPFAVALPASAIVLFGLALTARDGVVMLIAFGLTAASIYAASVWLL